MNSRIELAAEVAAALHDGRPVVALETSIVGQGLPAPHNLRAASECEAAIRDEGAVPATIAVLDGKVHVGLDVAQLQRIADGSVKVSSRDLGPALADGRAGATTVAATMRAAAMAGIKFFATGGIGGVHRGHPDDQSADLVELVLTDVAVFCAGPKIILDLPLTMERLESLGVPVLGFGCDEVPGFYVRSTGCRVSARVDGADQAARTITAAWDTGTRGVLVCVPPPDELENAELLVEQATIELGHLAGAEVTPRLLARVAELSGGRSIPINIALVVNNSRVAAQVARAYARMG